MKNWKSNHIQTESVIEKQIIDIEFESNIPLDIKEIHTSCSCTKPRYSKKDQKLYVEFKAGKLPPHLWTKGFGKSTKTITIRYENGSLENLSFTSIIKREL